MPTALAWWRSTVNGTWPRVTTGWPPGPPGNLLFGHLRALRRDRLGFLSRLARDYGEFVPLRFRGKTAVFLNDPDLIETMLFRRATDYSKNNLSDFFHPTLRRLLLFEESSSWLEQRRLAQPALRPDRMPAYAKVMVASAERMCDGFEDAQVVDVAQAMRRLTLDILARSLFDLDLAEIAGEAPAIFDAILDDVGARAFSPIYVSFLPTGSNWRSRTRFKQAQGLVNGLIASRRLDPDGRDDLLSALIRHRDQDGRAMTDDEVKLTLLPMSFAGHETTAMALTWALYLLAGHRDVERRLYAELESALHLGPVCADAMARLPLATRAVHETLRLYPPIWGFGRQAIRDTELGPYRIPSGTTLFASQWVLHRDPRYFEDPLAFNPDRWSSEKAALLPRCAYMPFGAGPRRCLGSTFAMLEAVLVLATILRRFSVSPVPGSEPRLEPLITLRAKGLQLEVKRRVAAPA
jgi:cytochrome P450